MSNSGNLKGISPLVATVLLIAFVVAIAGIIATWANSFAREQTELVGEQSELSITCSYGHIQFKNAAFQTSASRMSGTVENIGQIPLGDMRLSIIYQNASSETIELCSSGGNVIKCQDANLSVNIGGQTSFNVTVSGSNYDSIKLVTNCTSASDELQRVDISSV